MEKAGAEEVDWRMPGKGEFFENPKLWMRPGLRREPGVLLLDQNGTLDVCWSHALARERWQGIASTLRPHCRQEGVCVNAREQQEQQLNATEILRK